MQAPTRDKILIVDDERYVCATLAQVLHSCGFAALEAASLADARRLLGAEELGAVLLDIDLPDSSGLDLLPEIREQLPETIVVMITGRVARSDVSTILLQGETGTGKDLFARAIHQTSDRTGAPYIAINCAALPASLIESELFGYEKGAFTDAKTRKEGLFEQAQGGTLFLDEIGEMNTAPQAKLLRVLEENRFRRVGGLRDLPLDARV